MVYRSVGALLLLTASISAVDYSIYRTCEQTDFCNRLRYAEGASDGGNFNVVSHAFIVTDEGISVFLLNRQTGTYVDFNITVHQNEIVRFLVQERNQAQDRYHLPHVYAADEKFHGVRTVIHEDRVILDGFHNKSLTIWTEPFSIDLYNGNDHIFSFNKDFRLTMVNNARSVEFAFDVFFPQAIRSYGIPEHADRLALRTTTNTPDPYRLWNSDTPAYDVNSRLALYGSVPILYGHGTTHTAGIFVGNAGEQWIDITNSNDGVTAYFMAEGGVLDLHLLPGPTPEAVVTQYTTLTGTAPPPQLWALGYHQSRWNYLDQDDVTDVIAQFDNNNIPIDVIWGDVETQDFHRYFTWNPDTFNNPIAMLNNLSSTHRYFVTHVDPHYKVDDNYFVYAEGKANNYFVKDANGLDFVGESWPGDSSWIDFFNEDAVDWYAGLFAYNRFNGTNSALGGIWNDMNEPAVFNDTTEKTMDRSTVFYGNIAHRDVHNMYSFTQVRATYEGLMDRDNRENRPFILSRSFFAGSQRYAAVWTGDNVADWEHLDVSYAMCLSISLAGISMCGADVGGFYGNPDTQLLTRWYQAGAWFPFFRAHASNGTERREPYLFGEDVTDRIRSAIQKRYTHIPVFYTLFYEHFRYGYPVIRPLFYEYPTDRNVLEIDNQLFLGSSIMVRSVTVANATTVSTYFPGGRSTLWYDIDTPLLYRGVGLANVNTNLDWIPVYYKGGSVVFKKDGTRRNTYEMEKDPYTIYVFLDENNQARGTIYQDDFHSFGYSRMIYIYLSVFYDTDGVHISAIDAGQPDTDPNFVINSYVVYRPPATVSRSTDEPVALPEPIVVTKTADGRNLRDLKFNARTDVKIKLF